MTSLLEWSLLSLVQINFITWPIWLSTRTWACYSIAVHETCIFSLCNVKGPLLLQLYTCIIQNSHLKVKDLKDTDQERPQNFSQGLVWFLPQITFHWRTAGKQQGYLLTMTTSLLFAAFESININFFITSKVALNGENNSIFFSAIARKFRRF